MAQEFIIRLTDDLDRSKEADETISFALRGYTYEIDLTKAHVEDLEEALAPYIKVARRQGAHEPPAVHPGRNMSARRYKVAMREWGNKNGWPDVQPGDYHPRELQLAFEEHIRQRAAGR